MEGGKKRCEKMNSSQALAGRAQQEKEIDLLGSIGCQGSKIKMRGTLSKTLKVPSSY